MKNIMITNITLLLKIIQKQEKLTELFILFGDSQVKKPERKMLLPFAGTLDIMIYSLSVQVVMTSPNKENPVISVYTPLKTPPTPNTHINVNLELCVWISTPPLPLFQPLDYMTEPSQYTISEIVTKNPSINLPLELKNTPTPSGKLNGTPILLKIIISTLFPLTEEL